MQLRELSKTAKMLLEKINFRFCSALTISISFLCFMLNELLFRLPKIIKIL